MLQLYSLILTLLVLGVATAQDIETCDKSSQFSLNKKSFSYGSLIDSKVLDGTFQDNFDDEVGDEFIGNLTVLAGRYQGVQYYLDNQYNTIDFQVDLMTVVNDEGSQFPLYKVYPGNSKAIQFQAVSNPLGYKFSVAVDHTVYLYDGTNFNSVLKVSGEDITPNEWMVLEGLDVGYISDPFEYVIAESSQQVSTFTILDDSQYQSIYYRSEGPKMNIVYTKYDTSEGQDPPTQSDAAYGPTSWSNRYGAAKMFRHIGNDTEGRELVVWQDQTSLDGKLTFLKGNSQETISLTVETNHLLKAAAQGADGEFYYVTFQKNQQTQNTYSTVQAYLYKAKTSDGSVIQRELLETGADKLNVYQIDKYCHLVYSGVNQVLALHITRTMTQGSDGLNHQGSQLAFYSATTLEYTRPDWGGSYGTQTAGHSFAANLKLNSGGTFTGMDLGDNYPRGITMWVTSLEDHNQEDVYHFKTFHGQTATSPAGASYDYYADISSDGKYFYKWSNDNEVYTELSSSGFVEQDDGYSVFFIGESPALDNSQTGDSVNSPRNIGFTKVSKDLSTKLSPGDTETGGFYDFNGGWNEEDNEGIVWLTDFQELLQSASRLKIMEIEEGNIMLLFEIWSPDTYEYTAYMIVDKNGVPTGDGKIHQLCFPLRLLKSDDPILSDGQVIFIQGEDDGTLNKIAFKFGDQALFAKTVVMGIASTICALILTIY